MRRLTVVIFCLSLVLSCNAYRILVVYPSPSYSHQIVQHAVSEGLAEAGHHVTVISPFSSNLKHPNIKEIVVDSINTLWRSFDFSKGMTDVQFMNLITEYVPVLMDIILNVPEVKKIMENRENLKYDAVIIENIGYISSYAIAEHFNATLIGLTSLEMFPEMHTAMGNPGHPILHRSYLLRVPSTETLIDRCRAIYSYLRHNFWMYYEYIPGNDWVIKKHFNNVKYNSRELFTRIDLAIEGQSPVLANTRPILPNTVQISFLHVRPVKALPKDLESFLDGSKHGVVYVSFGSNVKSSSLPKEMLESLIETFRGLKYDVLWKFETEDVPNKPPNVMVRKWLPQQDVLAHKNIRLFIMQGGMQSLEETIARGVPVLVIPFFSDQETNADKVCELRIGQRLDLTDLTKQSLTEKINQVIDDRTYQQKTKRLGDIIRDAPMPPVKTAVWWIEYAIRNRGAQHMKYKGTDMSFWEYYFIDVILVHLLVISGLVFVVTKFVKGCYIGDMMSDSNTKKSNKNKKIKHK